MPFTPAQILTADALNTAFGQYIPSGAMSSTIIALLNSPDGAWARGVLGLPAGIGGSGTTWFLGSGIPSSGLGAIGDVYLDTTAGNLYGQKTGGGWGSPVANILVPASTSKQILRSGQVQNLLAPSLLGRKYFSLDFIGGGAAADDGATGTASAVDIESVAGATLTNSTGGYAFNTKRKFVTVGANALRYGHLFDGTPAGARLEAASTNVFKYSNDLTNAVWTKGGASATTGAVTMPNGLTLGLLTEDTSTGSHRCYQLVTLPAGPVTATFFVKPNGRNWVYFTGSTGTAAACYLNVTTGATGGTPANILGTSSQALDGGYYRVSITYTNALTTIGAVILYLANSTPAFFYTGDGASGMYVGLCQIEALSSSTTYIATTTATASRSADVSSFPITNFTADQFTVAGEFVAPMDAYTTNKYVFDSSFDTNNRVYAYCSGGNIYFAVLTAGTSQFASLSVALTAGQKYKFACVVDAIAVTAKLKVTGVAQATAALAGGSYTAPTAPTALYAGNSAGASQLNSLLSQVHVIDRAWTTTEIANWVG